MDEAAAEMDQARAMTAWEQALRDGYIAQQVYILMGLDHGIGHPIAIRQK